MSPSFLWGAATSSHQIEGDNRHNDWWNWELQGNIEGGVRSGRATDHWHRFREDIRLAKELGLNSYRFSIEWSRIEPEEGKWSREALDWYCDLVNECEKHGLTPMATLHHFTSPQWFAEIGGFTSERAPETFRRYVDKVAQNLVPRVPYWCTINEPIVYLVGAYLGKFMPPAITSPAHASLAFSNLLRCHALAYDTLHRHFANHGPSRDGLRPLVGFAHNMLNFLPDKRFHPLENLIASQLDRIFNHAWLDAVTGGRQAFSLPGLLPRAPIVKEAQGRKTADFIGINYYTRAYVQWRPRSKNPEQLENIPVGLSFSRRREAASDLDWAIDSKGFGRVIRKAAAYKLPLIITENGIADKDDSRRPQFLLRHLREVARAIHNGADIRGYYHWSLLDNFEWIKGFWPRFGLYSVNYETFERQATYSATIYRDLINAHAGTAPDLEIIQQMTQSSGY